MVTSLSDAQFFVDLEDMAAFMQAWTGPLSGVLVEAGQLRPVTLAHGGLLVEIIPGDPFDRRVVDFLAGMTDRYALSLYEELFFPEAWPL